MSENNTDLNEVFEEEMDDADVITVPIDETLSNSGEAADAAAVGAALALKADKDELPATIKVNNQSADNQGLILIDGTDIPVNDQDTTTLAEAVEELSGKTAATIPMTGETGSETIGAAISGIRESVGQITENMYADKIPMFNGTEANTISEAIGGIREDVEDLEEAIESMEEKTAANIPMESGSTTMVKNAIETLDQKTVKSVNRKLPDANGDVDLSVVPLAENLQSDKLQAIEGEFVLRTTGGNGAVADGKAYPQHIYGNTRHDGFVEEKLNLTVIPITRTEPDEPITAEIDRDTFIAAVTESSTINLYYTTEWSEDPEDYGVTVTGDPVAGDQITIVYVKEVRGTILVADPDRLVGTGWNLFNANAGYARVVKYSETYGYKIGGTYTSIAFSATLTGDRTSLLPNANGLFNVPSNGYVFVTGGNTTDTYILATWSDWTEGPSTGYWEAYRESGIDLAAVVETYFPYGMLKIGTARDEIDLVAKRSISRIEWMVYSEENRATAEASGQPYDFDESNIYIVRTEPVISAISIGTEYSVSEHGMEWFTETVLPLDTEILYGKNLRDKLERDVLTISQQTLTEEEKAQVRTNIGAMSQAEGDTKLVAPTEAGTAGQLLHLKEDGGTEWTTQGTPTDAQVGTAVSAWLTAHPEATTTVQDGAISRAKLNDDLKAKTDAVSDLKSALISNQYNVEVNTINSNSDIDDILTPGNYKVTNGTVAETLSNLPVASPGRLTVCTINDASHILQIYVTNTGDVYIRCDKGGTFTDWTQSAKTGVIADYYDPDKGYFSGEFCFYNGTLYCRKNNGSAESSFTPTRWNEVKLADLFYELKAAMLIDSNNLLFNTKNYRLNYYYNTSYTSSNGYIVFVVPVTANTTYYSNKTMRFVSKAGTKLAENVKQYTPTESVDLYISYQLDEQDPIYFFALSNSFDNMVPYLIFKNGMMSNFQRNIDERNLLNHAVFLKRGYYYNGSQGREQVGSSYSYLVIYVENGTTYYIHSARMLSKASSSIVTTEVNNYAYTANYTGKLYITVYNNRPWIVSTQQDMSDVAPYNCPSFTEKNVLQSTGSDTRRPMSQKAVTDALAAVQSEGSIYAALLALLPGKKIAQFGDSIMAGDGNQNTGIGELLAAKYGMTVYEYAVGGATMGTLASHTHIIDKVNQAIAAAIQPDIILIDGGTNDMHGTTPNCPLGTVSTVYTEPSASDEFSNGFESVAYKVKSTWPEAMVIYFRAHNMSSRAYDRQITYGERGIEIAEKWGFGVIDMYKRMNTQLAYYELYVPDHTHPNEAGYNKYYIPSLEQYLYERRNEFEESNS